MPSFRIISVSPTQGEPGNTVTLGLDASAELPDDRHCEPPEIYFDVYPMEHPQYSKDARRLTGVIPPNVQDGMSSNFSARFTDQFGGMYEGRSDQVFYVKRKTSTDQPKVSSIVPTRVTTEDVESMSQFTITGTAMDHVTGVYFTPKNGGMRIQGRSLAIIGPTTARFSAILRRGEWTLFVASAHTPGTPVRNIVVQVT